MIQRFLDPAVLAGISSLDLVAKTVVDGFISGLHESPDFGFSQEFAEYRQYMPGDDLRHVDWNVFARSDKMFLKRFKGETNTLVTVLIDASKSMAYGSRVSRSRPVGCPRIVRCGSSSAFSTAMPLGLMYFFTPAPRLASPTSPSERYLPERKPLASE